MPIQRIVVPRWAQPLWEKVQKGPVEMSATVARCAADARRLQEVGLAIYEDGALRLLGEYEEEDS